MPREHKIEHRNPVKDMTDEELEAAIEFIQMMLATQAEKAKVIDGTTKLLHCRPRRNLSSPGASAAIDCLSTWTRWLVRVARLVSLSKLAQHVWVMPGMLAALPR